MTYKGWIVLVLGALAMLLWREPEREQAAVVFSTTAPTQTQPVVTTEIPRKLPWVLSDAGMIVETLVEYEGPFWEDGTDDPVVGVMALQVYNPGLTGIRYARIEAWQGGRCLAFEITYLPPNSRVLVLEKSRQSYAEQTLTDCCCTELDKMPWVSDPEITVAPEGMCSLRVENRDAKAVAVLLRYKTYDETEGLYLGGVTHSYQIPCLAPGERISITPYRYLAKGSRLVQTEGNREGNK